MRAAVVVALLAVSSVAVAQPGLTPPTPAPREVVPPPPAIVEKKSGGIATVIAIAGSVLPILVLPQALDHGQSASVGVAGVAAVLLLPSAGHWYAGQAVTVGMGLRAVGGALVIGGLLVHVASDSTSENAEKTAIAGIGVFAIGALYDIATASSAVDKWNQKHATSLRPTVMTMKASDGFGLGVAGRF